MSKSDGFISGAIGTALMVGVVWWVYGAASGVAYLSIETCSSGKIEQACETVLARAKVSDNGQSVVIRRQDFEPYRLKDCAVFDRLSWSCANAASTQAGQWISAESFLNHSTFITFRPLWGPEYLFKSWLGDYPRHTVANGEKPGAASQADYVAALGRILSGTEALPKALQSRR